MNQPQMYMSSPSFLKTIWRYIQILNNSEYRIIKYFKGSIVVTKLTDYSKLLPQILEYKLGLFLLQVLEKSKPLGLRKEKMMFSHSEAGWQGRLQAFFLCSP